MSVLHLFPPVDYTFIRRINLTPNLKLDICELAAGGFCYEFIEKYGNRYKQLERGFFGETADECAAYAIAELNDLGYHVQS